MPAAELAPVPATEIVLGLAAVYNRSLWPLPVVGVVAAAACIVAVFIKPTRLTDVIVKIVLDMMWLLIAGGYFALRAASHFNWAYAGALLFALQGTFFLVDAMFGGLSFGPPRSGFRLVAGGLVILVAALGYPAAQWFLGRRGVEVGLVGTAAGATALFTLGFLVLAANESKPLFAFVPALWPLVMGAYLGLSLGLYEELVLAAGAAAGAGVWIYAYLKSRAGAAAAPGQGAPSC
jgi:hypothetical protein